MADKRLIRFATGPMTGQFRYVTPRSGCMQGAKGVADTVWAKLNEQWKKQHQDQLPGPKPATETSFSDCADKHRWGDKEYKDFIERAEYLDLLREMNEKHWLAVMIVDIFPGIVPIITPLPGPTLPPIPVPPPPTPSP